jgi:RHS repeat-associated protein
LAPWLPESRGCTSPDHHNPEVVVGWSRRQALIGLVALLAVLMTASGFVLARRGSRHHELALYRQLDDARVAVESERDRGREILGGLGEEIDKQFEKWGLTTAEPEVALLILKGLRHKEIASARRTTGGIIGRMDYGPFGQDLSVGTGLPTRGYAGLFRDGEAGLDHADARSYQSRTGRFSTVDPVYGRLFDPQGWNRYAYALNRPLNLIDPTWLQEGECQEKKRADDRQEKTVICPGTQVTVKGQGGGATFDKNPFFGLFDIPTLGGRANSRDRLYIGPRLRARALARDRPSNDGDFSLSCGNGGAGVVVGFGGSAEGGGIVTGAAAQASWNYGIFNDTKTGISSGSSFSAAGTVVRAGSGGRPPQSDGRPYGAGRLRGLRS